MAAEQAAPAGAHASSTVHGEDSQRRASHAHLLRQVPYTNVCVHAKGRQADVQASLLIQLSASTTPNNSAASRSERGQMLQSMQGAHRYSSFMPQHSAPFFECAVSAEAPAASEFTPARIHAARRLRRCEAASPGSNSARRSDGGAWLIDLRGRKSSPREVSHTQPVKEHDNIQHGIHRTQTRQRTCAAAHRRGDEVPHVAARGRVHPRRRLIEVRHLGVRL